MAFFCELDPSEKEELEAMISNGGEVAQAMTDPGVTHIITMFSRPEDMDICEVTPAWVTESYKRGQRLLEYDFEPKEGGYDSFSLRLDTSTSNDSID